VRRPAEREQDGALGQARRVLGARRQHHPLGDLLGNDLAAGRGEGSGVDGSETVHAAIVAARCRSRHRLNG
jgi:hypothetical protein